MRNISIAIASILALTGTNTFAGSKILDPTKDACTTTNCGATTVSAVYTSGALGSDPFTIQVYAAAGECLRLAVTSQPHDLEMGVFSPDIEENHWVDDDSNGLMPVIKIDPTPNKGWYIVALSQYEGANVDGRATLMVGRYNSGIEAPMLSLTPLTQGRSIRSLGIAKNLCVMHNSSRT